MALKKKYDDVIRPNNRKRMSFSPEKYLQFQKIPPYLEILKNFLNDLKNFQKIERLSSAHCILSLWYRFQKESSYINNSFSCWQRTNSLPMR